MNSKILCRKCPICDCVSGDVLHTQRFFLSEGHPLPSSYDVVACDECGFCFADTAEPQAVYDVYYADMSKYADTATSTGAGLSTWDAERMEHLAQQIASYAANASSRILDIGCANGGLIAALQHRGYDNVCGIDPAPSCVEQARRVATADVWTGTFSALPAGIGKFDGVILSHVMEHVRELRPAIDRVREMLNPDGWIYVEVPDAVRYVAFLVAPFQDFNTEHINHFSTISLANLCRRTGFLPTSGGIKEIFSAKGMPYPSAFWFARKTEGAQRIEKDELLRPALYGYIGASRDMMARIDTAIRRSLDANPDLIVWGTGQLTMKLLADTCLRKANILAFVDGNPVNHGRTILGRNVVGGRDLTSSTTPILICSLINSAAIIASIQSHGLTNPIITLSEVAL